MDPRNCYSAADAWLNVSKRNRFSRWHRPQGAKASSDGAAARIAGGLFLPALLPGFKFSKSDSVFCIGSCFARHIEDALLDLEFSVPSRLDLALGDITNKYNVYSMLNELQWALEPDAHPFPNAAICVSEAGAVNPMLSLSGLARPMDEVMEIQKAAIAVAGRIRECRLVIVTLGLVEAWYDRVCEIYLTEAPSYRTCRSEPDRYELRVLSYAENMAGLEAIHTLIRRHCPSGVRILVSVSPVPFQSTFTCEDVVVANTYSKSTLRAVATDFVMRHSDCEYLPSYESVMNSAPGLAWESDRMHVTNRVIRANVLNFLAHYLNESEAAQAESELNALVIASHGYFRERSIADENVPDFEMAVAFDENFTAGIPSVEATSVMAEMFGPANLVTGSAIAWHAAKPPQFPQQLDFTFAKPLHCKAVWLQTQDRHPERGPTFFTVAGMRGNGKWKCLVRVSGAVWEAGSQWQKWNLPGQGAFQRFRIIIQAGNPEILTLQRVWFQPDHSPRTSLWSRFREVLAGD